MRRIGQLTRMLSVVAVLAAIALTITGCFVTPIEQSATVSPSELSLIHI